MRISGSVLLAKAPLQTLVEFRASGEAYEGNRVASVLIRVFSIYIRFIRWTAKGFDLTFCVELTMAYNLSFCILKDGQSSYSMVE